MIARFVLLAATSLTVLPGSPLRAQQRIDLTGEKLIQLLEAEYRDQMKKEKDPLPVQQAARMLAETTQGDNHHLYVHAVAVLRRHRHRAAVPLLLRYMAEHGGLNAYSNVKAYTDTLSILTGEEVRSPYILFNGRNAFSRDAVEKLVTDWWVPNRNRIEVDPEKMTAEQRAYAVGRLMEMAEHYSAKRGLEATVSQIDYQILNLMEPSSGDRSVITREDLHPTFLAPLLTVAGHNPDGKKPAVPAWPLHRLIHTSVPMIAILRRHGLAPGLEKLLEDNKVQPPTRLVAALALMAAREEVKTEFWQSVLETDPDAENRVIAALTVHYTRKPANATPAILKGLTDRNQDVQEASVTALRRLAVPEALPHLKKILDDNFPARLVYPALQAVANIKTKEARAVLAGFLEESLRDAKKSSALSSALRAFEDCTNKRWTEAGANEPEYYREKAKEALAWWKKQQ